MTRLYNKSLPMNRFAFGKFAREVDDLIDEANSDKIFWLRATLLYQLHKALTSVPLFTVVLH